MTIRPVDVPEVRAEIQRWLDGPNAANLWDKALRSGYLDWMFDSTAKDAMPGSVLRGFEINRLAEADLFHVSADMVELALAAAPSIPGFGLAPEDLPSPTGLMIFERPPINVALGDGEVGIKAVCWSKFPNGDEAIWGTTYADREEAAPILSEITKYRQPWREPKLIYSHGGEFTWSLGSENGLSFESGHFMATFGPFLKATWILMQQPIAKATDVELYRAARRRLERAGQEPKPVRVIDLRRPQHAGEAASESDREYHHRWIVRGHWRQQWYPSREVHRPVWIAPHIKGPDDKPLLGGEKVYSWTK